MLIVSGCGKTPIVSTPPASCSALIPQGWKKPVQGAAIPKPADTSQWIGKPLTDAMAAAIVAPWASWGVEQTGQLDKANGRTADGIAIMERCEALVNAARQQ